MAPPETRPSTYLARLRERLAQKGHTLLDNEWRGKAARYRFRCAHGHETSRTGDYALRSLIGCPTCEAEAKLARLRQVARHAGGECLSTRYGKRSDTYRFRCRLGHAFETRGDRVLMGGWCPCCALIRRGEARRDPTGLARIQEAARKRGGEWLPQPYARMEDAYRFRCAEGHEWTAPGVAVARGKWCRLCANKAFGDACRRKDGLDELRRIAQEHGGQCLSHHYENARTRYHFRCAQGHEWGTQGWNVLRGTWCLKCANSKHKLSIEVMREMAAERGGHCLSDTYVNVETKLEWECSRGHRWHSKPHTIRVGHWCPQCAHLSKITQHKTRLQRRYEAVEV
ncbi:hypothetical protein [Ralstonia pseudosolanacearum]|uniref:Conserved hypothethical protein n=1 Tax=Ralstonia solanacearum TaxID=305 RepID=A0A0S4X2V0_RALSL|nr:MULTISPECIES: hypothetical protein [Ralstonia]UZF15243.1 hypothetical protein LH706_01870 [Ralstonia solanacearum]UZF30321.1 hypothetical protein LGV82_01550 [Ralstonia sp. RS650]CUV57559.1 Conserved hypothethical protein [Ralstonia solanacearum]